ncbi:Uncharacterized conserved protein YecE, DUF72 family [Pseudomonas umsongensis]|uniref:DUF72 domain-containing protein n=1 Tax=Pseudomonas umsongensis TaxID=198618 RepID=UPI0003431A5C|nr:DUF72 domain-containing protein [Pseudomonas umsongensis]EPA92680.1 hypothetical protein PG5_63480 [Pseudomonas sp. G5(2012)]SDT04696.1 Uncharacterized conserved protein YecE, DUF72 family [Pseudomonas umsongensis]
MNERTIFTGCAGWSLGREHSAAFTAEGTHLQRYAARLNCAEINSSFYRPHRQQTYQRWAASVPAGFRFSVKVPKLISHVQRLQACDQALDEFVLQCSGLGDRLGCLLVQLPPSLVFDESVAEAFFISIRRCFPGPVVLEPRHESWVGAEALLVHYHIAQVAVDPSRISTDSTPRGWPGLKYWRLHGSPRIYYSPYELPRLERLAVELQTATAEGQSAWCIFDNTASGAALGNALTLAQYLAAH